MNHMPSTKRDLAVSAASTLRDCKQFVKNFHPENIFPASGSKEIQLFCEVELTEQSEEYIPNPPPELLVLPPDATIADLKLEAMKAFQEVYLMFRRFQAEELMGYSCVDESTQVKLLLGSAESVRIRGKFIGENCLSRYRMERGTERWIVDCICGAMDDDGERMLACDVCGVWQHTRCSSIPDSEAVPTNFYCLRCRCNGQVIRTSDKCKDDVVNAVRGAAAAAAAAGGYGKSMTNTGVS